MSETTQRHGRVQKFGDRHTAQKQSVVVKYLSAYINVMKRTGFCLSYVDAFVGCGARVDAALQQRASQPSLLGPVEPPRPLDSTAIEAIRMNPGFNRYIFGDTNSKHLDALQERVSFALEENNANPVVKFLNADANKVVLDECDWLLRDRLRRAVIFLDPYGMQVEWATLKAIAASGKADLWLLLPTGIAVNRLVTRNGVPSEAWKNILTRFYGTDDWMTAFYEESSGFFGGALKRKITESGIVDYTMGRLRGLFGDGLLEDVLPLRINGRPQYHLVFACSSPNPRAREIAHRIARNNILRSQMGS